MKVCKCPHIRLINSCINITYDVIFFTPACTRKPIKLIAYFSLLKGMVHCGEWVECMGVASGCGEQEAGVASGSE